MENSLEMKPHHSIYAKDMKKAYGKSVILADIDLAVSRGEFVTMVGQSGCGKSTLFRIILGQERCTCGTFLINGETPTRPNKRCGIVFQQNSLYPHLTALEHVTMSLQMHYGWPIKWLFHKKEIKEKAIAILQRFGLEDHMHKYPTQLSGGQTRRVAIAQSTILKPEILLMDEPFRDLDPFTREQSQMFLLDLWRETGITIIFVTHELDEAIYLGSRVIALSKNYTVHNHHVQGARIVGDYNLGREIKAPTVKTDPEFQRLKREIHNNCMDPAQITEAATFHGNHPDSFFTLDEQ